MKRELTDRQRELLALLPLGPYGIDRKNLARDLYGRATQVNIFRVQALVRKIRAKGIRILAQGRGGNPRSPKEIRYQIHWTSISAVEALFAEPADAADAEAT